MPTTPRQQIIVSIADLTPNKTAIPFGDDDDVDLRNNIRELVNNGMHLNANLSRDDIKNMTIYDPNMSRDDSKVSPVRLFC